MGVSGGKAKKKKVQELASTGEGRVRTCSLGLAILLRPYNKLINAQCIYCLQQLDKEVTASDEHVLQACPPEKLFKLMFLNPGNRGPFSQ